MASHVIAIFRGDFLLGAGRHVGGRWRTVAAHIAYTLLAGAGAIWIFSHPGQADYRVIGGMPLAASAAITLILAVLTFLNAAGRSDLILACVRWGRRAVIAYDFGAIALVSISATCGIATALYSAHVDGIYNTRLLRADAFSFAFMAGCLGVATHGVITRPLFSAIAGRPRTTTHLLAAASRVLILVSLFASIAELVAPGATTWITVAATLLLTSTGWEVARQASADQALRQFTACATAVQSAASRPDGDLIGTLAALENACLRRALSRRQVVEGEVGMVVRACLERIDPNERRTYPNRTVMADLQAALEPVSEEEMRREIAKFATALRQSLVLREPLAAGNIWTAPQPSV